MDSYEIAKAAGKLRTAARKLKNIGNACHLCKGGGEVFEMEGWYAPTWNECYLCDGTGAKKREV